MIDWENLHVFAVFAAEKSLSAAARVLKIDHATVARRIASLEHSLQLKLVDRRLRTYSLTQDGERVAQVAARMLEETHSIGRIAKAGQQQIAGEVSISAPPSTAAMYVVPQLGKFRRLYPGIHLKILAETRIVSLPHQEADIAVRLSRPQGDSLVGRKIGDLPFGVFASKDYLSSVKPENFEFIALDESLESSIQQQWLREIIDGRDIVLRTNSPEIQSIAVCGGAGVAVLPNFLAEQYGLKRVAEFQQSREIWLVVHEDFRHTPAIRVVMDFLVDCFIHEPV